MIFRSEVRGSRPATTERPQLSSIEQTPSRGEVGGSNPPARIGSQHLHDSWQLHANATDRQEPVPNTGENALAPIRASPWAYALGEGVGIVPHASRVRCQKRRCTGFRIPDAAVRRVSNTLCSGVEGFKYPKHRGGSNRPSGLSMAHALVREACIGFRIPDVGGG